MTLERKISTLKFTQKQKQDKNVLVISIIKLENVAKLLMHTGVQRRTSLPMHRRTTKTW